MFDKWIEFFRKPKEITVPSEATPGVNMHGSMFLHRIKKIELDYQTRQSSDTATATMKVTDIFGHEFTINCFSPEDGEHIEVHTHDHNEK